jgi:hypothetical protein
MALNKTPSLEKILNQITSSENIPKNLNELYIYLNNHSENLTLSEYKRIRNLVDGKENSYKSVISQAVKSNSLDKSQVDKVGRLLTTFLRNQHYILLSLPEDQREIKRDNRYNSPYPGLESNSNRKRWEQDDRRIYELERKTYGFGERDKEKNYKFLKESEEELINSIDSQSLDKYNISSLQKISNFSNNSLKKKLNSLVSKIWN